MKNQIIKTLILQYVLGVAYLLGAGLWDSAVIFSALVGCAAALVPKTYFGLRMLRDSEQEKDARSWLGYAYRSEIGKWVIMGAIFAAAFTTDYPWDPVILFVGFVLIQLSGRIAPLVIKGN